MVGQKTSKLAKFFTLENFRLYGMCGETHIPRDMCAGNMYHCDTGPAHPILEDMSDDIAATQNAAQAKITVEDQIKVIQEAQGFL